MIDIHTHILPGLDDGAADLEQSMAMARVAIADGVTAVVATPHAATNTTRADVLAHVGKLQIALDNSNVPLQLYAGIEVWLSPDVVAQQRTGHAFAIANGPYMLVELPLQMIPPYTEQAIFALQVAGIIPILAHPERYVALEGNLEPLYRLVSRGVLCQLSASSLLGGFGPRARSLAESILQHDLAHVIASDAHSADVRPPKLAAAMARATELVGEKRARDMVTTVPECIVAGRPIDIGELSGSSPKRRWYSWRR
jgi:protein-tyrosine phosphatase